MLRIFIADDEYFFRQYLKACLPWASLGYTIVGEAANGEDALSGIEALLPDIALLDINMPLQDGLEVSRIIAEKHPQIKLIILTGHLEFHFAQKAIQHGVKRYMLKPLDTAELQNSLAEIRQEIQREQRYRLRLADLEGAWESNVPRLREKLLEDLLTGRLGGSWDAEAAKMLALPLTGPAYTVIAFAFDDLTREDVSFREWTLWKYAVSNIALELFGEHFPRRHHCELQEQLVFLVEHAADETAERIRDICAAICKHVDELLEYSISIGIGKSGTSLTGISISYQQALIALRSRPLENQSDIRLYGQPHTGTFPSPLSLSEKMKVHLALQSGDFSAVSEGLNPLFARMQSGTSDELFSASMELLALCLEFAQELEIDFAQLFPTDVPFDFALLAASPQKSQELINALFIRVMSAVFQREKPKSSNIVDDITAFVEQHYQDPALSITTIADALHITYHHLCHSYKKQTDTTINQYITEKRIAHAKTMIENGHINVALVAELSGFNDSGYFSRCFKRTVGVSPSEYIKLGVRMDGGR